MHVDQAGDDGLDLHGQEIGVVHHEGADVLVVAADEVGDDALDGRDRRRPQEYYIQLSVRHTDIEIEGLLDGLRYAAHKSLHVLVGVAIGPPPIDVISGRWSVVGPLSRPPSRSAGTCRYTGPDLRWLVHLAGRDRNAAERMAYERHLWDGPVDPALTRAVEWLRAQRP